MAKKKEFALSRRELDIMNVLWEEGKPLKASDFPDRKPELSINTVQSVLKKLLPVFVVVVVVVVLPFKLLLLPQQQRLLR